ncbi:MAG TPA: ABC transporter permease [Gemmatimonadaceae bacterium]
MTALVYDIRHAFRSLRRSPGFTTVVVLMLALGIGATTTLFSVVNAALLRPLPYPDPDRIVSVSLATPMFPGSGVDNWSVPAWQRAARSLEMLAAYGPTEGTFTGGAEPERLTGTKVSPDFFRVLGASPALGRTFLAADDRSGAPPVIVLAHSMWTRDFGADPNVLGRTIELDGKTYTVIGVMPADFRFPRSAEYWTPLKLSSWTHPIPGKDGKPQFVTTFVSVIGRLRPGVTLSAAQAELANLRSHVTELRESIRSWRVDVMTLHDRMYGDLRPALLVLLGTVASVLLIACANVANLLLVRAAMRRRELAVRAALGAGRARLVRQLLVESLLLALIGGAFGLLLPVWGLKTFVALGPESLTHVPGIAIDGRVLMFAFAVSMLTGVLFGLVPALSVYRDDPQSALKEGATRIAGSGFASSARKLLVTAELAIAVVLLIGAGLLAKSFVRYLDIDPGFRGASVLTAGVALPSTRYSNDTTIALFYRNLMGRLRAMPGVQSATATAVLPLNGYSMMMPARSLGLADEGESSSGVPSITSTNVGSSFFRTLGIPLHAGRDFTDADDAGAPPVAIVNQSLARLMAPNGTAIGHHFTMQDRTVTIVGVCADVRQLAEDVNVKPAVYFPLRQTGFSIYGNIAIRVRSDPLALVPALRQVVRDIDPQLPLTDITTMDRRLADSMAPRRFNTLLLGTFAALALVMAVFGLYGVIAYLVAQRTHEIGVRMALGAQGRDVIRLVLRQGVTLTVVGVIVGLAASFALTRLLASLLFRVQTTDPVIFVSVPVLLILVSIIAMLIPARRAVRVDPQIALRAE